jgi:hypothetical protein
MKTARSRFKSAIQYVLRHLDPIVGLILFVAGLYGYTYTLAPTVLDGDAALFQYTPAVLGVTYPTGYPLYILLGKLWLTIFPFGEMAWRMNLFSALCSAAALPLIYGAARRLLTPAYAARNKVGVGRWAALVTVLTFATIPSFWRWSTEAKIYALNILLFSGVLCTLAVALEKQGGRWQVAGGKGHDPAEKVKPPGAKHHVSRSLPLALPALLLGLQIAVHSTTVLLLPGMLLLIWLNFRRHVTAKSLTLYGLLLILPGLLYSYVPLRAEWLLAQYGREEAIARGLLADYYHSGWAGWVRYFTAADFTGGVVTNWGLVPQQFLSVYLPILMNNLTRLGATLGLMGGLALAFARRRLFWPLFLMFALPIPFVLTYGQGEQSAFLLPSFLIFSLFVGHSLVFVDWVLTRFSAGRASGVVLPLVFLALIPTLFFPQTHYNFNRLDAKWSRAIYDEWADALAHPLEPGAAMLAHWGDLTSFWYMQVAEGLRPDLLGLYPPTEKVVTDYLNDGHVLYIAGPLQGWAGGIEERFQLIPWGRLVRIAPLTVDPQTLLPALPHPSEAIFDGQLRLLGADFAGQAAGGGDYPVTLTWQALADLPPETTISLRLSRGNGILTQLDDTLLSGWFPRQTLPAGRYVLSYARLPIPLGTLPGNYRLQLVAYTSYQQPWPLANGATLLDLGEVEIVSPPADFQVDSPAGYLFGDEIELVDYDYSVARVGQGKGFAVRLIWRAKTQPVDNYTLLVEALDRNGNLLRAVEHQAVVGQAPTSSWQPGQFIRDQVDLVIPASAPPGQDALQVRLSWQRPGGSKLSVRRGWLPLGENLDLEWLTVTEKEGRVFEVPQVQVPLGANLGDEVRLIGYNSPQLTGAESGLIRLQEADCQAASEACQIHFDLYWQALREMDQLYWTFLHLVDEQGQIVTQHDRGPGIRAKQPTTAWLPGEVMLDPVDLALPEEIPPGRYTLRLGMYLPPEGPRLPILDGAGAPVADFVEIGKVEIEP